jgi:hypothetical protein
VQGARAHDVTIHTDADPTGGAVEFAFVAVGAGTAPSSWTAGTWGTWDAVQEKVTATTPTTTAARVRASSPFALGFVLAAGRPLCEKLCAHCTLGDFLQE